MLRPRPRFHMRHDFIIVAPIRLTSKVTLKPGTKVNKEKYGKRRLRSWYRRKRIGVKGSEWTKWMIARYKERLKATEEEIQRNRIRRRDSLAESTMSAVQDLVARSADLEPSPVEQRLVSPEEMLEAAATRVAAAIQQAPESVTGTQDGSDGGASTQDAPAATETPSPLAPDTPAAPPVPAPAPEQADKSDEEPNK